VVKGDPAISTSRKKAAVEVGLIADLDVLHCSASKSMG
jgi:hypothetical protein